VRAAPRRTSRRAGGVTSHTRPCLLEAPVVYTTKLTNANIAGITFHQTSGALPDPQGVNAYEEITFTYQRIEWSRTGNGITVGEARAARVN
jgi:type VI protein secretion system component Hcp